MSEIITPIGTKKKEPEPEQIFKVEIIMEESTLNEFLEQTGAKGVIYYPITQS